jgi:hypothetical protein
MKIGSFSVHLLFFVGIAAAILLVIGFKTPVIDTGSKVAQSNLSTARHLSDSLAQLFSPNSGQEVLPGQVRAALALLQNFPVASYRLSPSLEQVEWVRQRMIEAAWPVKMENTSAYLFCSPEEFKDTPGCDLIGQREDVVLAHCP